MALRLSCKALRPIALKLAKQPITKPAQRTLFTSSTVRSADLVQQMYLSELSRYKPTPLKANDANAHVQKFAIPKAPVIPDEAKDMASGLKEYEAQQPDIEGSAAAGGAAVLEDWFEEAEEEKEEH